MPKQSVIVIDDFYEDPDSVRELALSLDYHRKPGATYPGVEAVAPGYNWSGIRQKLRAYIDEPVDAPCPKKPEFPQGKFRIAVEADEETRIDRVHVDQQRWSGVIYLSKDQDCREGLALYRHRATGSVEYPSAWLQENYKHLCLRPKEEARQVVLDYFKQHDNFEQIGMIPMAYNRAILLMAKVLHGTGVAFGADKLSGRLTQHFEFYEG
jgi:Family of unknown function (DUF6445)